MSFLCQKPANRPSIVVAFVLLLTGVSFEHWVQILVIYHIPHRVVLSLRLGGIMFNTQYLLS